MEIKPFLSLQRSLFRGKFLPFCIKKTNRRRRYLTILLKENKRQCNAGILLRVCRFRNAQGEGRVQKLGRPESKLGLCHQKGVCR